MSKRYWDDENHLLTWSCRFKKKITNSDMDMLSLKMWEKPKRDFIIQNAWRLLFVKFKPTVN